jgi:serine/threonine-protein kinase
MTSSMGPSSDDGSIPESGQVLSGKYQLVRRLGEGGMGVVYEAKHLLVGRHFAVKVLQREVAKNAEVIARFRREAVAAGALDSEHVVSITDFGFADDGSPYMVMELLHGEDSRTLFEREGPLPVARATELVLGACRALGVAHAQGIIHRDLKPDNLFLVRRSDGSELVKVLDFGIAKLRHDTQSPFTTKAGQMLGTVWYMPPEQVHGAKDVDHRADIHALGVILYEGLTGELPHPGNDANAVMVHILHTKPRAIAELRPSLPPGLGAVVHKAIARRVEDRFQSVDEFAQALAPYASSRQAAPLEPAGTHVPREAEPRLTRTSHRRVALAAVALVGSCAVGLGVVRWRASVGSGAPSLHASTNESALARRAPSQSPPAGPGPSGQTASRSDGGLLAQPSAQPLRPGPAAPKRRGPDKRAAAPAAPIGSEHRLNFERQNPYR